MPVLAAGRAGSLNINDLSDKKMLTLNVKVDHADSIFAELVLPYELRENSRLRTKLASGEEVAIFTARGTVVHLDVQRKHFLIRKIIEI